MDLKQLDLENADREELIRLVKVFNKAAEDSRDFHKASIAEYKELLSKYEGLKKFYSRNKS